MRAPQATRGDTRCRARFTNGISGLSGVKRQKRAQEKLKCSCPTVREYCAARRVDRNRRRTRATCVEHRCIVAVRGNVGKSIRERAWPKSGTAAIGAWGVVRRNGRGCCGITPQIHRPIAGHWWSKSLGVIATVTVTPAVSPPKSRCWAAARRLGRSRPNSSGRGGFAVLVEPGEDRRGLGRRLAGPRGDPTVAGLGHLDQRSWHPGDL